MLQRSVLTPCDRPAAADLCARVSAVARRLGVTDPVPELNGMLRQTFARPAGDPAYRTNWLQPGALPLEWSFSEADPDALRIELQPFDPVLASEQRLQCAVTQLLPVVRACHGETLAAQFEALVRVHAAQQSGRREYGAFVGLVGHAERAMELKIYVELSAQSPAKWREDVSGLAGVVPHFCSIAIGAAVAERVYYLCRDGLRILDLEGLCAGLGMPQRFPALLVTLLELTGGQFYLPPRSVLLGIRRTSAAAELKIELVSGLAMNPHRLAARVERLLPPPSAALFRRWLEIVFPETPVAPPLSMVSLRTSAERSIQLSAYAAEPW